MIELKHDRLEFHFPEVDPQARVSIEFQRTLRIPDDGETYPLPPGLGKFPLRHVDDHAANVPADWLQRGGVMLPMFQAEAMWLNFQGEYISERATRYPFAIKVATGKECAVSGESWQEGLTGESRGRSQNYMVVPGQPWLDGYVVEKGLIRQFVAMPLGGGYTAEEQLTGKAKFGGVQIAVYPMKREVFERRFPKRELRDERRAMRGTALACAAPASAMGLAPGGRMKQEIYRDPFNIEDWDLTATSRCFVHLCNSLVWEGITGQRPPHPSPTSKQYTSAGLPWFDYYDDNLAVITGSARLAGLKSVAELSQEKNQPALPENESVTPKNVHVYRQHLKPDQVREGAF